MKKAKEALSLFLVIVLVFSSSMICSFAESVEDVDARLHSVKGYLIDICGYDESELNYETIDNVDYIYTVLEGEASIVNVHNQYRGEEKLVFTFPTTLGGYTVTTIGDADKTPEVFWYINYGEEVEYDFGYYPEYDPANKRYYGVVIPEGYKEIMTDSLRCFSSMYFSFPKSLRYIGNFAFESLYTNIDTVTGEKRTVLPECSVWSESALNFQQPIVLPSRDTSIFCDYTFSRVWGYGSSSSELYVPYNVTYDQAKEVFYDWDAFDHDIRPNGGWYDSPFSWSVHCAPDSPWLQVIKDMGGHDTATIITDIPKAEYIQFPDKTVNIHVGDVVDLEAKTYPTEAIWTACDYTVSDPSIVKIDEYSGRITALKEGTVTVTATHCERGFVDTCTVNVVPEPVPGVNEIKPVTDTPYYSYGNRDYTLDVTGSPSKIQVVRDNGGTTTIDRRRAKVTSNGETETWVVNMRVEAGTHNIRAKYGNKWDERLTPFTVTYDTPPTPKAYSFDLGYKNGLGTFEVVTDPQIIKVQFVLDNGCTLTYSQGNSYVAEDGLRHWVITRKIPTNTNYTLKTKFGYTWTTTNLKVTS